MLARAGRAARMLAPSREDLAVLAFLLLLFAALVLLLVIPAARGVRDTPPNR